MSTMSLKAARAKGTRCVNANTIEVRLDPDRLHGRGRAPTNGDKIHLVGMPHPLKHRIHHHRSIISLS